MAAGHGAIMKRIQQQRCGGGKCFSHFLWTLFVTIFLVGFVVSQELLHYRLRIRYGHRGVKPLASDPASVLQYSQINPAVIAEREKIKYLLEKTEVGKIRIRDVIYPSSKSPGTAPKDTRETRRQRLLGKAWMLPLTSHLFDPYLPKFFHFAKAWFGERESARIMQDLVQTVKRPLDRNAVYWSRLKGAHIDERGRNKYQSCAVVGNSGILLNGSYGEQIDSNEMVIRLNNAEIFQYKKHVGSKTSLSFMNSNIFRVCSVRPECWCHPYGDEVPIILYICQAQHLMHTAMCSSVHKSPLLVTHSLFDALCAAIAKWYSVTNFVQSTGRRVDEWDSVHSNVYFHYSSGMQAIVLALGICDRVDIFGFGKFSHAKHHYHTEQKEELSLHDYAAEYLFYDDLVHYRNVPFLTDAGISIPPVRIFS